jgi:predicted RNase H-like HicB family nuclease
MHGSGGVRFLLRPNQLRWNEATIRRDSGGASMTTIKYVYWQEDGWWVGYLQDYPDYRTQGQTLDELKDNLKDLYGDISGGHVPAIRKVDELIVP